MSETHCDNKSVGVIIKNDHEEVLLLQRARFPFGLAPPAGHIDGHGSAEQTALDETWEEVGICLPLSGLKHVVADRRVDNVCRRTGGTYHIWNVFEATYPGGPLMPSKDETHGAGWYSSADLQDLAEYTESAVEPTDPSRTLENVWLSFFRELGYIK